jgi:hypothetical protein
MSDYERCKKCSLTFRTYLLENGLCRTCRGKIQPDAIPVMEFKPLTPLLAAYEKEMEKP